MNNIVDDVNRLMFLERVKNLGKARPQTQYEVICELKKNVQKISIEGKNYILKKSELRRGLAGIAASRMYNQIGILTPSIELVYCGDKGVIRSVQEDVTSWQGIDVILAEKDLEYLKIDKSVFGNDKWQIFYDFDLMQAFLQFMTPECLEQLKNMYLVDELRTERDRWLENFYLCKSPESSKYEGVIAIDLDEMAIYHLCRGEKDDFDKFLNISYRTTTPQQTNDYSCYKNRIWEILSLAYDGVLSESNISVINKALKFDLPKELEKLCEIQKVSLCTRQRILEPIKRLWDYNNKTLDREFGD